MTKLKQTNYQQRFSMFCFLFFFLFFLDKTPQDIAPIQNHSLFKLYLTNTNVEDVKNEIHTTGSVCILNALKTIASSGSFPYRRT